MRTCALTGAGPPHDRRYSQEFTLPCVPHGDLPAVGRCHIDTDEPGDDEAAAGLILVSIQCRAGREVNADGVMRDGVAYRARQRPEHAFGECFIDCGC